MAKETEKRLLETLEFLQEPHGSTIPTIVKAMNVEAPQLSLKKIVQTLRGCLDNGVLKVADGRVKFKKNVLASSDFKTGSREMASFLDYRDRSKAKAGHSASGSGFKVKSGSRALQKPMVLADPDGPPPPEGEGGEGGENGNCPKCPECPKPKKKKPKCPKKKPKCPKPKKKPKCPKPKPKPKCPKKKPKKCPKKKIQPYCRKKKSCGD